jgi:hypothetical protein
MDAGAFGELSKRVAQAATRRDTLRTLAGGLVVAMLGSTSDHEPAEAAFGYCRLPGKPCSSKKQCCAGKCSGGVCGCAGRGHWCINRVGVMCCSGKCRRGKCK